MTAILRPFRATLPPGQRRRRHNTTLNRNCHICRIRSRTFAAEEAVTILYCYKSSVPSRASERGNRALII
ncbi:hypothetical protein AND_007987 [Anopheles darlingi]|uniref:Uncharacterized protein n=2 Tax=Anopheles darlingi TaxID=43151 RepID=W5JC26_ANODA|nr:hypothetical protein AND_007987 [Anopheles darlingi]